MELMSRDTSNPENQPISCPVGKIDPTSSSGSIYNLSLILAFVANLFQMIGISLLFRYSDFINHLGGSEWELGWIIGVASVGALAFRIVQGPAVDRIGPSAIWLFSIAGQLVALYWHMQIESASGFQILFARMLFATSVAGNFGAWLSFISLQSPANRIAEVIGVVGASGFLGMAIGPTIGDWIFREGVDSESVHNMFAGASANILIAFVVACCACLVAKRSRAKVEALKPNPTSRRDRRSELTVTDNLIQSKPLTTNVIRLVGMYHPGWLLAVGAIMGMAIGFPTTYVRPMAETNGIEQIKVYFITYNLVAFLSRIAFRKAPQILGLKKTILVGLACMASSMPLYLVVDSQNRLWIPAVVAGLGHSFLFPSVVASCNIAFPTRNRGVATNLILSMYDIGVLVGMPLIGLIITVCRDNGFSEYPTVLAVLVMVMIFAGGMYWQDKPHKPIDSK